MGATIGRQAVVEAKNITIDGVPIKSVVMVSRPPSGKCRIINVYWDPVAQRAVFEYEDVPSS